MTIEVAREYRLEVDNTREASKVITAATKANPGVFTSSGLAYAAGDYVRLFDIEGMYEVDNLVGKVAASPAPTATTFAIEGLDTTNFGTFVSGKVEKILTWMTVAQATGIDFGAGAADEINVSVLLDNTTKNDTGLMNRPAITVNLFTDPALASDAKIDAAAYASTVLAWRATRKSGKRRVWAGKPSTIGESVAVNAAITGSFTITVSSNREMKYAS